MFGRETNMELDFEQVRKNIIVLPLAINSEKVVSFQRSDCKYIVWTNYLILPAQVGRHILSGRGNPITTSRT